jgi:hypothetical protein
MALLSRFSAGGGLPPSFSASADDGMPARGCADADGGGISGGPRASTSATSTTTIPCRRCPPASSSPRAACRVREEPLCRTCALSAIGSRCKRLLTAHPAAGRACLLAASGGEASASALDIVRGVVDCGRKRRAWAEVAVVHVDASSSSSPPTTDPTTLAVVRLCASAGFPLYLVPLEAALAGAGAGLLVLPVPALAAVAPPQAEPSARERERAAAAAAAAARGAGEEAASPDPAPTPAPTPAPPPLAASSPYDVIHRLCATADDVERHVRRVGKSLERARGTSSSSSSSSPTAPLAPAAAALAALLAACSGPDARADAVSGLTRALLARATAALGFSCLLTFESADTLTQRIMNSTFSGEGYSLPVDVAAVDERYAGAGAALHEAGGGGLELVEAPLALPLVADDDGDGDGDGGDAPLPPLAPLVRLPFPWYPAVPVTPAPFPGLSVDGPSHASPRRAAPFVVLRPFSEVEGKELALFSHYRRLDVCPRPSFSACPGPRTSVAHTAQSVLAGLQSSFPSTVHNVVRTVRKLILPPMPTTSSRGAALCPLCDALLPPTTGAAAAEGAGGARYCARCERLPVHLLEGKFLAVR